MPQKFQTEITLKGVIYLMFIELLLSS